MSEVFVADHLLDSRESRFDALDGFSEHDLNRQRPGRSVSKRINNTRWHNVAKTVTLN